MKFLMVALVIVVALNLFVVALDYQQRSKHAAFFKETGELVKKWEAQDRQRDIISTGVALVDSDTVDTTKEIFIHGFEAGVKWGIISYMQNPEQNDLDFHIREAQKWYWFIVVDGGKSLLEHLKEDKE